MATLGPIGNIYSDIIPRNLLGQNPLKIRFGHRKPSRESIAAIFSADILTFQGESICTHPEPPWWSKKSDFQKMQKRHFLPTLRPCGVLPYRGLFVCEKTTFFEVFTEAGGRLVPPTNPRCPTSKGGGNVYTILNMFPNASLLPQEICQSGWLDDPILWNVSSELFAIF